MKGFKVSVTVTHKKDKLLPIWDGVHLSLTGDNKDLFNLQRQLDSIKRDVNRDMNSKGIALRNVDISVDFL